MSERMESKKHSSQREAKGFYRRVFGDSGIYKHVGIAPSGADLSSCAFVGRA